MTAKQIEECELVRRLFKALHIENATIVPRDPPEPDVLAMVNGRRIGIEVTAFHGDEGQNSNRGSKQRKIEEQINKNVNCHSYGMWPNVNPIPALCARIEAKIARAKSYPMQNFDELWLLIVAQYPQLGALASTFIFPCAINMEELNTATDGMLQGSPFKRVNLQLSLDRCLYEWSSAKKWSVKQSIPTISDGSEVWFKPILRDPEWLRDPVSKARMETKKAINELLAIKREVKWEND